MANESRLRVYVTFKNTPDLLRRYRAKNLDDLLDFTIDLFTIASRSRPADPNEPDRSAEDQDQTGGLDFLEGLQVVAAPSLDWRSAFVPLQAVAVRAAAVVSRDITPDELIVAYTLPKQEQKPKDPQDEPAVLFVRRANALRDQEIGPNKNVILGAGFDPGGSTTHHWCPGTGNLAVFGHRRQANRTIRADELAGHGLLGQRVNVVIIDSGLDRAAIPAKNWGGGLDHYIDTDLVLPAGSAPRTSHGMMIARSILDLAPEVRLYDVPVISSAPPPLPVFLDTIQAAYTSLLHEIRHRRHLAPWKGPWVLVNAWGIYDTSTDPTGSYTENEEVGGHPFINLMTRAVQDDNLDIIFSAGNCGTYCPSQQCGPRDRGPDRSIWGANAHPLVITVGAVCSDETWIGYSSQGKGPKLLDEQKPDFCAPSQFVENHDAALLSSGTSASCAVTAGVVAALRGNPAWDQGSVPPAQLKAALINTARKPSGQTGWDRRLGNGILDVASAITALP